MKYPRLWFVLVTAAFALTGCDGDTKEEINNAFDAYISAVRNHDAATAISLTDDRYFEDMQYLINAAKTATRDKIERMRPSERATIIMIRNRLTPEQMKTLDARAVESLRIGSSGPGDELFNLEFNIKTIKLRPPRATLEADVDFLPFIIFVFEFVQADGVWKINPNAFDEEFDKRVEKRAVTAGMRESTLLQERETRLSGKRVNSTIWDPPK